MLDEARKLYSQTNRSIGSHDWHVLDTGGSRLPLILLPGAQGTAEIYAAQFRTLATEMRTIGVTYPNLSDAEQLADGFEELLADMEIDRAVISGSSYSGLWLQSFAARHPERIAGLILANTFIHAEPVYGFLDKMLSLADEEIVAGVLAGAKTNASKSEAHKTLSDLLNDLVGVKQTGAGLKSRLLGVRSAPPAPVAAVPDNRLMVIDCDNDPIVTETMRDALAARYKASVRTTVEGGEHYPAVLKSNSYTNLLRDFYLSISELEKALAQ